jgi:hypothetical protein
MLIRQTTDEVQSLPAPSKGLAISSDGIIMAVEFLEGHERRISTQGMNSQLLEASREQRDFGDESSHLLFHKQ